MEYPRARCKASRSGLDSSFNASISAFETVLGFSVVVLVVQPINDIVIIRTQPKGGRDLIIFRMLIYCLGFEIAGDVSLASP
jgi:hypothetical protein